METEIYRI